MPKLSANHLQLIFLPAAAVLGFDLYLVADMQVVQKLSDGQIVRVWARKGQ